MKKYKKFNELNAVEKYKRLRGGSTACFVGKWVSILSPYLIIGIVNFEDYFTEANGIKMSMGCTLAMIVAGIAIFNESKENKKINGLVGWAVAFALCYLLSSILQDLVLIVGCGLAGQIVGAGFELGAKNLKTKAILYRDATINAESLKSENIEVKTE